MGLLENNLPSIIPEGMSRVDWFAEQIQAYIHEYEYHEYYFDELYDATNKAVADAMPMFHTAPNSILPGVKADFTIALGKLVDDMVIWKNPDGKFSWIEEDIRKTLRQSKRDEEKTEEALKDIVDLLDRYGVKLSHCAANRSLVLRSLDDLLELRALLKTRLK